MLESVLLPTPQSQNEGPMGIQGYTVSGGSCMGGSRKGTPGLGGEAYSNPKYNLLLSMVSLDLV